MDELKRGFWGYRRDSVYRYIVLLEEEASKRVAEKEARIDRLEAESQRQIAELEREHKRKMADLEAVTAALREENRVLRDNQELVFSTMLEAQKYAGQLKADSVRQARQAQEKLSAAMQRENQRLSGYAKQVQQLRSVIQGLLEELDGRAEDVERAIERLQAPGAERAGKAPEALFKDAAGAEEAGGAGAEPPQNLTAAAAPARTVLPLK